MKKKPIPKAIKIQVWNKYIGEEIGKHKCLCCLTRDITQASFHCGHYIAESKGGATTVENMRPICELCNKSMGTMNMQEFKECMLNNKSFDTKIFKKIQNKTPKKKNEKIEKNKTRCIIM